MARILLFTLLLSAPAAQAQSFSPYYGAAAVERTLATRLFSAQKPYSLISFVGNPNLIPLLGVYSGGVFRNGTPSPVNLMLWKIAMTGVSTAVSVTCLGANQDYFNEEFLASVSHLCDWPAAGAQADEVLLAYWISVMGYQAPESEYLAWRVFTKSDYMQKLKGSDAVYALTVPILMNPHFLVRK